MSWTTRSLADVATFDLGKMLDRQKNTGELRPYLANINVRWGQFALDDLRETRFEDHERERYGLKFGDIVMCEGGEPGRCAIWKDERPGVMYQKALHRIRPGPCLDHRFLYFNLRNQGQTGELAGLFTGSTIRHLPREKLAKVRVPVPPMDEQRRIADVLSAYDELIEVNRKRIALLEAAARLLHREWFVHFRFPGHERTKIVGDLPEGWGRRTLGDVVDLLKQNVRPSAFEAHDIHVGLEHIPRRSFTLADWEPAEGVTSGKLRFAEGDILFCKIRPYLHKVGFAIRNGLVSSDALVWRVRDESDWAMTLCATSSDHFVAVASKTAKEGSKMPRADWNVLRDYPIPSPPRGLIGVFNHTVRRITAQCKTLAMQNKLLGEARDLTLPRIMRGEISV